MPLKLIEGGKPPTNLDTLIDDLFTVLPARDYEQIAQKLTKKRHKPVSFNAVMGALAALRADPGHYGWTVPHVKRGSPTAGEEERYKAVLVKSDGSIEFGPGDYRDVHAGCRSTVASIAQMAANEAAALVAAAAVIRSYSQKRKVREFADDLIYVGRKATALLGELTDEDNGRVA